MMACTKNKFMFELLETAKRLSEPVRAPELLQQGFWPLTPLRDGLSALAKWPYVTRR